MKKTRLYHATSERNLNTIFEDGFEGGKAWDYTDVVFFSDRPLYGFGDCWIAIDVPDSDLPGGKYYESEWDDEQYHCACYCFKTEFINKFPRYAFTDSVPGFNNFGRLQELDDEPSF